MSVREEFWTIVCRYSQLYFLLLALVTVLFVLDLFVLLLGPPRDGSYVVAVLVLAILGTTMLGIGAVLWQCQRD